MLTVAFYGDEKLSSMYEECCSLTFIISYVCLDQNVTKAMLSSEVAGEIDIMNCNTHSNVLVLTVTLNLRSSTFYGSTSSADCPFLRVSFSHGGAYQAARK